MTFEHFSQQRLVIVVSYVWWYDEWPLNIFSQQRLVIVVSSGSGTAVGDFQS